MVIANPAVWEEERQRSNRHHDKLSATLKSRAKPFSHIRYVKSYLAYQPSRKQLQPSGFLSSLPPRQLLYLYSPWGTSHSSSRLTGYFPLSVLISLYLCLAHSSFLFPDMLLKLETSANWIGSFQQDTLEATFSALNRPSTILWAHVHILFSCYHRIFHAAIHFRRQAYYPY